jgi:hypothetical protein
LSDDDSQDIQEFCFGCSNSGVREKEVLDDESLSSSLSPSDKGGDLEEAINEIRTIGTISGLFEEPDSNPNSDIQTSDDENMTKTEIPAWQRSYQCMYAHDGSERANNPNSKTIEILSKMQAHYERTMDEWRAISYRKAISILKKTTTFISTEEQARAYSHFT